MIERSLRSPRRGILHMLAAILSTAILLSGAGCETGEGGSMNAGSSGAGAGPAAPDRPRGAEGDLERTYIIGPTAARELNYRIQWQYDDDGAEIRRMDVLGDSVFIVDARNYVTRLSAADGARLWRVQVADPIENILGINYIAGTVYITSGSVIRVFEGATGSLIARHDLQKIAATSPAEYGPYLVYGSRNGQVVWHAGGVGFQWRAYQVANAITIKPVIHDGFIVALGQGGIVMVLDASTTSQYWSKKLLSEVVAAPAVGNQMVYIAGLDQYVWAYDLASGRNIWRYLTDVPLRDAPVLVGERLYQQIPGTGLVAFDALSFDSYPGRVIWTAGEIAGNVLVARRDELFTWDAEAKVLAVLTEVRGGLKTTLSLPQVKDIATGGEAGEDIFAVSADGRVIRLVPRT